MAPVPTSSLYSLFQVITITNTIVVCGDGGVWSGAWRMAATSRQRGNLTAAVLPTLQRFSATRSSSSRPAGNLVSLVLRRNEIGILSSFIFNITFSLYGEKSTVKLGLYVVIHDIVFPVKWLICFWSKYMHYFVKYPEYIQDKFFDI